MAKEKDLLPEEYRRRGLVTLEFNELDASLFAPKKLARIMENRPGHALTSSVAVEEHYIVIAHRLDGVFDYTIEHEGVEFRIPGPVIDRVIAYREGILKEARKLAAEKGVRTRAAKAAKAAANEGDRAVRLAEAILQDKGGVE